MKFKFKEKNLFSPNQTIHFIGIGGIGMSSIAALLTALGFKVQGSDITTGSSIERLKKLGIKIFTQHNPKNLEGADIIVISSAIKPDNIEYLTALSYKLPVYKRGRILGEIMSFYYGIAVSGSHGKTTTTALIGEILLAANFNPTVVVGGVVNSWKNNVRIGKSPYFVAEGDESDGSFLNLPATISVVTNIEAEHLDYYKTYEALLQSFTEFINQIPFFGFCVACADDPEVQKVLLAVKSTKVITYGFNENADYQIKNIVINQEGSKFNVFIKSKNKLIKDITVPLHGNHNALNALAALAVADRLDIKLHTVKLALSNFKGISRRFTKVDKINGVQIIDDYAHHPSEIKAVLTSAKRFMAKGKIIAVVEPHRFSRLKNFFNEYVAALKLADEVIVMPVYAAGEKAIPEISSELLVQKLKDEGHNQAHFMVNPEAIAKLINQNAKTNDFVICMGAGSITNVAYKLPKLLNSTNVD